MQSSTTPPDPKWRCSEGSQGPGIPMSVLDRVSSFSEHFVHLTAPCSTASGSKTLPTEDTQQKPCWVIEKLSVWNRALHLVGVELRQTVSGHLQLSTFRTFEPNTPGQHEDIACALKLLLNNHPCVKEVDLIYMGEQFGSNNQLLEGICPNTGVEKITLDGNKASTPDLSRLVRGMLRGDPVELRIHGVCFAASDIAALLQRIETSTQLSDLILDDNKLKCSDILQLLEVIENCKSIKVLDLRSNPISVRGAQRLANLLTTNTSLLSLLLSKTQIEDQGAVDIGHALAVNKTLEYLSIAENYIGPTGGECFGASLRVNKSLVKLNLGSNQLRNGGGICVAKALESNETLKELNLCWNNISDGAIVEIAESLAKNRTIVDLDISNNELKYLGLAALARLVSSSATLKHLNVGSLWDEISAPQFQNFVEALAVNRSLEGFEIFVPRGRTLAMLSQGLRSHHTIRDLSIGAVASDTVLFDALAANYSVREFEFLGFMSVEAAEAFANLLRTTPNIRSVALWCPFDDRSLLQFFRGLSSNASVWSFTVPCTKLGTDLCGTISSMLEENRTLDTLVLDGAVVDGVGLRILAEGLSTNKFLRTLSVKYPASSEAAFNINEILRRNNIVFNRALRFALKKATDKDSAIAFQLHQRNEFFVHKLSELPEVTTSCAESRIRRAKEYIVEHYFVLTGVVMELLECPRPRQGTVTTLFDDLNSYCIRKITSYLKVSDVKS